MKEDLKKRRRSAAIPESNKDLPENKKIKGQTKTFELLANKKIGLSYIQFFSLPTYIFFYKSGIYVNKRR